MKKILLLTTLLFSINPNKSLATIFEINPTDNIITATNALQPGDILELTTGLYSVTSRFGVTLNCTAALPCINRAKAGHTPHVNRPNANQNIMDIENSTYVTFKGIEFKGLNFTHIHIHHINGASVSQGDGIELKEGCYNNVIRDNVFHHTDYPCLIGVSSGFANTGRLSADFNNETFISR